MPEMGAAGSAGGTRTFSWNPNGTLDYRIDPAGNKVKYTYDALKRVRTIDRYRPDQQKDMCRSVVFAYDTAYPLGQPDPSKPLGRLVYRAWGGPDCPGGGIVEKLTYNKAGLVTAKQMFVQAAQSAGFVLTGTWVYDSEGRVIEEYYPDGQPEPAYNFGRGYDALGRQDRIEWFKYEGINKRTQWAAQNSQYNAAGQLTRLQIAGSVTETREYNDPGQLIGIRAGTSGNTVDLAYQYRSDGRVASMEDQSLVNGVALGEKVTYGYDSLKRLTSATATGTSGAWHQGFLYDEFGNLTGTGPGSVDEFTSTIDSAKNRVLNWTYDQNGNVTNDGSRTYVWDADNRLAQAGTAMYSYDPENHRLYDGQHWYFWSPDGRRLAKYRFSYGANPYVTTLEAYVYFGGRHIVTAKPVGWAPYGMQLNPVLTDRVGSVRVADSGAKNYYPYGKERVPTANGTAKFGTYFRDTDTGLDYADQRYYVPGFGRFLSADPSMPGDVANPGSWNFYAYVGGDPINYIDPEGLARCDETQLSLNGRNLGTIGSVIAAGEDWGLLTQTVFVESRTSTDQAALDEISMIGAVIMNRWQIVNGYYSVYDGDRRVQVVPDWGRSGDLSSIIKNPSQFGSYTRGPSGTVTLEANAQARLTSALGSDYYSDRCAALFNALVIAGHYLGERDEHALYTSRNGLAFTSFNSFATPKPSHPWEERIGSSGSANVFYGISASSLVPRGRRRADGAPSRGTPGGR
jgi:RHS repeat-associated protein